MTRRARDRAERTLQEHEEGRKLPDLSPASLAQHRRLNRTRRMKFAMESTMIALGQGGPPTTAKSWSLKLLFVCWWGAARAGGGGSRRRGGGGARARAGGRAGECRVSALAPQPLAPTAPIGFAAGPAKLNRARPCKAPLACGRNVRFRCRRRTVFSVVLLACYTANLTAHFTVKSLSTPIDSLEDICERARGGGA